MNYYQCLMCGSLYSNTKIETHLTRCAKNGATSFATKTERSDHFQSDEIMRTLTFTECYIPIVRNQIDPEFCKLYESIEAKSDSDDEEDEYVNTDSSFQSNESTNEKKAPISQTTKRRRRTQEDKNKKLKCPNCDKKFDFNYKLKKHMLTHQSPQSRERPFLCDEENCGKSYYTKYQLERHMEDSHTNDKDLECEVCHKSFQTLAGLKGHLDTQHLENRERKFSCHICSKMFLTKGTLREHVKTHGDDPDKVRYVCNVCNKTFHDSFGLKRHMKTHLSPSQRERPFLCNVEKCGRRYLRKDQLDKHILDYHAEKHPACKICHKSFRTLASWKRHQNTQHLENRKRKFICHICSKGFFTRDSLTEHVKRHADKPEHECDQCDKAFKFPYPLKLHKRVVHDRDYPYRCSKCGKGFVRRDDWNKHSQSCVNNMKMKLMKKSQKRVGRKENKSDLISMKMKHEVKEEVELENDENIIINCVYSQNEEEELDQVMIVTDVKLEFPNKIT